MIHIPNGIYLEPADLGLAGVVPAAAGGFSDGKWLDWIAKFPIVAISLIKEHVTNNGATTIHVYVTSQRSLGESFATVTRETLWSGATNSPRTQFAYAHQLGIGVGPGSATVGSILAIGVAQLFAAPAIRFSLQNNHATLTDTLNLSAIAWFEPKRPR